MKKKVGDIKKTTTTTQQQELYLDLARPTLLLPRS